VLNAFTTNAPGTLNWVRDVTGFVNGETSLIGIDVRVQNGTLYGVGNTGVIYTISVNPDPAYDYVDLTKVSQLGVPLSGTTFDVDFNPAADRLRVISDNGQNLRVNVDDGKVTVDGSHKFKEGDANAGKTPKVIAGAYSNSFKGTQATGLYNIDETTGSLVSQAPPNDGVLNTIGSLGIKISGSVAFNIVSAKADDNAAWLVTDGAVYTVDLKTGKATMAGKLQGLMSGKLTDIAWWD